MSKFTTFVQTLLAVTAGAGLMLSTSQAFADEPGDGVSVQPAVATWTSSIPKSWVYVELLGELGYDVESPTSLSNPVAYLAITEGDVDYWPSGWFPLHDPQVPDGFEESATVFSPLCEACGLQGYLVDTPSVEEYGIEGIMDIVENDEIRQEFDHTGDGRVDLYGCPPGWGCHEAINAMIENFDLEDDINHVDAGYSANFAEVMSRIEDGDPTLYKTWQPSAWVLELEPGEDVMWVNAPGIVDNELERGEGIPGAVTDPIYMGFVPADIQVTANNAFLDENPAAEALFEQAEIPLDWISQVDAAIQDEDLRDEEVQPYAREWIEDNRDKVDGWLETARAAAE